MLRYLMLQRCPWLRLLFNTSLSFVLSSHPRYGSFLPKHIHVASGKNIPQCWLAVSFFLLSSRSYTCTYFLSRTSHRTTLHRDRLTSHSTAFEFVQPLLSTQQDPEQPSPAMLTTLITFLTASSLLSVRGATLPQAINSTSLVSLGDGRPGTHEGPSNCEFVNWMDPDDSCMCFGGDGGDYGIDRGYMIDAIIKACNELTGGIGEPVAVYGRDIGLVGGECEMPTSSCVDSS